jgi:hypothetical protein
MLIDPYVYPASTWIQMNFYLNADSPLPTIVCQNPEFFSRISLCPYIVHNPKGKDCGSYCCSEDNSHCLGSLVNPGLPNRS